MTTTPLEQAIASWMQNQAPVVVLAGWAIWQLGQRLDRWNTNMERLEIAINALEAAVLAHMPPGR